jgi:uncharacterized protein
MPVNLTYPGVYIEEISSGVRTITGVATSITAFVGRTLRGEVNQPTLLSSFGDFERLFGGLWLGSSLGHAVRDFYLNGGSQALIVRLFTPPASGDGVARLTVGNLSLVTANPGAWGNALSVTVNYSGINADVAEQYGLTTDQLFNLVITDGATVERIRNVSVVESTRRVDRVLQQESQWMRVALQGDGITPDLPATIPAADATATASGGADSEPLNQTAYEGSRDGKTGLFALEKVDLFNLLCIPADVRSGDVPIPVYQAALQYCVERRAMLIVDPRADWQTVAGARDGLAALGLTGRIARNAALYFPRVVQADPLRAGQFDSFVPCGIVAGVMARTDAERGVWKAPAGLDAGLNGIQGLTVNLNDNENGVLNPIGINCLRSFPVYGRVVWGARTLRGADQIADEYKYVPVRRFALFLEESLYRGTQWVVFEPNDEPLWAQIRLNIGAFMQTLFRQGAFQGSSPREAYFVKCDRETTTQTDINQGIVNIIVGFAPLKPAEFVVIKFQQIAGQIQT